VIELMLQIRSYFKYMIIDNNSINELEIETIRWRKVDVLKFEWTCIGSLMNIVCFSKQLLAYWTFLRFSTTLVLPLLTWITSYFSNQLALSKQIEKHQHPLLSLKISEQHLQMLNWCTISSLNLDKHYHSHKGRFKRRWCCNNFLNPVNLSSFNQQSLRTLEIFTCVLLIFWRNTIIPS